MSKIRDDQIEILEGGTGPSQSERTALQTELEKNPVQTYLMRLGEGSRRGQFSALRLVVGIVNQGQPSEIMIDDVYHFPWHLLEYDNVAAIRMVLQERFSPAYGNKIMAALKGVLKACWRLELMNHEVYARVIDHPPIKGEKVLAGRNISLGEQAALLDACAKDETAAGPRDAALLGLGIWTGLRIAETADLRLSDFDPETSRLIVSGKGNKQREVFVNGGTGSALADWIELRGSEPGPLFTPINKGGAIRIAPMSTTALTKMLRKRIREAGLEPFAWHSMRRTCVGDDLDAGVDLATAQKKLGHSSPATTARYDRRGSRAQQNAAKMRHMPYVSRRQQ